MVLSGILGVFLLGLSVFLGGTEAQNVDQNTLARIINHIQNRYHPLKGGQYAVAFMVPAGSCGAGFYPNEDFPPGNDPDTVRKAFTDRIVYQGNKMIGAVPAKNFHSEFYLLNPPNPAVSPMQNLLNLDKDGCLIFYTFNSPCDGTCMNPQNNRNILAALRMFHLHRGPKAFVFNNLFHGGTCLINYGHYIEDNLWLQRCFPNPSNYECHHCFQNNQLVAECQ